MESIIFEFITNRFHFVKGSSYESCNLGDFLSSEVINRISPWVDLVNNPIINFVEGNITVLIKKDNKILIGDLFSKAEDGGPYFEISRDKFIKMLQDWDVLVKQQPKHIFLTIHDNGDITLEGSND